MFIVFTLFQEDTNELGSTGSSSSRDQGGSTSEAERVVMYRFDDDEKERLMMIIMKESTHLETSGDIVKVIGDLLSFCVVDVD